jgi:hypothetical protein
MRIRVQRPFLKSFAKPISSEDCNKLSALALYGSSSIVPDVPSKELAGDQASAPAPENRSLTGAGRWRVDGFFDPERHITGEPATLAPDCDRGGTGGDGSVAPTGNDRPKRHCAGLAWRTRPALSWRHPGRSKGPRGWRGGWTAVLVGRVFPRGGGAGGRTNLARTIWGAARVTGGPGKGAPRVGWTDGGVGVAPRGPSRGERRTSLSPVRSPGNLRNRSFFCLA